MHNEASRADALFEQRTASSNGSSSNSSTSNGAAREANERGPSRNLQPASSGGVTGNWYGQARQGHSLIDYLTSEAARLQEETRQGKVQVQSLCMCWDLDPIWHCVVSFLATHLQPEEIHRLAGL